MRLILDTNCVLDYLHFRDPSTASIRHFSAMGSLEIVTSKNCFDEFIRVLEYPKINLEKQQKIALINDFKKRIDVHENPIILNETKLPNCRDKDDQKFIEAAVYFQCSHLISRDKQVLKLRKQLKTFGVTACTPLEFNLSSQQHLDFS